MNLIYRNNMPKKIALLVLLINCLVTFGQEIKRSSTYIDTYYHGEKHFSIRDASEIQFNEGNNELTLLVDFSKLKCGVDSLDEWLLDLTDTKFIFKGFIPPGGLLTLTHHNTRSIEVEGIVEFNGKSHKQIAFINFYEISRDGMLLINNGSDYYDRVAANIQLTFLPKFFGVDKKPHHLKKKISIAIGRGIINKV